MTKKLQQCRAELEELQEMKAAVEEKIPPQEEVKVSNKGNKKATFVPVQEEIIGDYEDAVTYVVQRMDPERLHANATKLPKLDLRVVTKMSWTAFKASAQCVMVCAQCKNKHYGANLACAVKKGSAKTGALFCRDCFVKLAQPPSILVFSSTYKKAESYWKTSKLTILFGYERGITKEMFSINEDGVADIPSLPK